MTLDTRDILDIHQLESMVHHAVDHSDQSMLHLVFTEDARFDGRLCGGPLHVGLEAIKGFFALGKPPHPPSHHMTNCVVYEKDGKTRVKMKWFVIDAATGKIITGDNDDVVVKTEKGWRVQERVASVRYPVPGA
jgi:SnoaL-like domain